MATFLDTLISRPELLALTLGLSSVALWLVYSQQPRLSRKYKLPPGPPQRWFSGNDSEIVGKTLWKAFGQWKELYGPVFYYRRYTQKIVVVNTVKTAFDLLETRSGIYSDRQKSVMSSDLGRQNKRVFSMRVQDPLFKDYRKMMNSGMNVRVVKKYEPIQDIQTVILLDNLLRKPENFISHLRRNAGALILKIIYGYDVNSDDDQMVKAVVDLIAQSGRLFSKTYLVEYYPILKYVPSWFPFTEFKRVAKLIQHDRPELLPFKWAQKLIGSGEYNHESFASLHLRPDGGPMVGLEEQDKIMNVSSALFLGGADTTVSAMTTLFYLLATHPHVQAKAQAELDAIVGSERLPQMSDLGSLPYLDAVIKELLRWHPPAPTGIPHRAMEDDVYENWFIPKGTTVFANIWAIARDPEVYTDPDSFNPERHLGSNPEYDPRKIIFGYGRRVCPGSHLAEVSLFLSTARVLACFNIKKPLGPDGKEIEPKLEYKGRTVSHLESFDCRIEPRSKKVVELIQNHRELTTNV